MVNHNNELISSSTMNSPAFARAISQNGTLTKDHGQVLKKFLTEMRNQKFDDIKLATYRCAAKLYYVQRVTNLYLVDIYNIIEAFRENGLNTLDHSAEIDEPRLESIIQSIYLTLYKRLPSTKDFNLEKCIVLLSRWIMHAYDSKRTGIVQVLSVKTALSSLCEGRLIDKFRYVFTQISETDGSLNIDKLDKYLKELLTLPCAIGEEPSFGYNKDTIDTFLAPSGNLKRNNAKLDEFLDEFMNMKDKQSGVLYWLHTLNKLSKAAHVTHNTQCKACNKQGFKGLRYKCGQCYNYNICQDCFWRDRTGSAKSQHKADHPMKEHLSWGNKGDRGTSVKKKLLCSPTKSSGQKLPDYPKEPEPNKTLDMSNIVPALPSEPCTPNTTLSRSGRLMNGISSHNSTLTHPSRSASRKFSQETVQKQDDEHRLISLYAQRLATDKLNESISSSAKSSTSSTSDAAIKASTARSSEPSPEQKEMLSNLEEKNRTLIQEINQLKAEHEEATKNAQQMGAEQTTADPNLITELRVLRQRKDELEMRMSALQETRRELMVQLEGLMKLLKNNQMNSPRQTSHSSSSSHLNDTTPRKTSSTGPSSTLMRGVNGDVKQAFGKTGQKDSIPEGQDLRADLMTAVQEVTSAMTTVVHELTVDGDSSQHQSSDRTTTTDVVETSSTIMSPDVEIYRPDVDVY